MGGVPRTQARVRRSVRYPGRIAVHDTVRDVAGVHDRPGVAVRVDLLDRNPGRRRHRRRREHLPTMAGRGQDRCRHRGRRGARGRQPDDPRDADRHRCAAADGCRVRHDGALHAADTGTRFGRDADLAVRRVRVHALSRDSRHLPAVDGLPEDRRGTRTPRSGVARGSLPAHPDADDQRPAQGAAVPAVDVGRADPDVLLLLFPLGRGQDAAAGQQAGVLGRARHARGNGAGGHRQHGPPDR